MTDATLRLIIGLQDRASAGLKAIQGALGALAGAAGDAVKALAAIGGAAVLGALGAVGKGLFEISGQADAARTSLQGMAGVDMDGMLRDATLLSARYGVDVQESIAAARALMDEFGISSDEAMSLVVSGFENGLNSSDDLLDTIGEYANQFAENGASAQQFFSLMQTGLKNGVLGTDKAADAFKEFGIRIQDGSDASAEALARLDMAGLTDDLRSGALTAAQAFSLVQARLRGVADPLEQAQIGVALFGTQWEDMGASAVLNIDLAARSMEDLTATAEAGRQRFTSLGEIFPRLWGEFTAGLLPANDGLLEMINGAAPQMIDAARQMGEAVGRAARAMYTIEVVAAQIIPALQSLWSWFTGAAVGDDSSDGIYIIMRAFGATTPVIEAVVGALWTWGQATQAGIARARELADAVQGALGTALGWLTGTALPALAAGWATATGAIDAARAVVEPLAAAVGERLGAALAAVQGQLPTVGDALGALRDLLQPLTDAIQPVIDGFGTGGMAGGLAALWANLGPILTAVSDLRTELLALGLEGIGGLISRVGEGNPALEHIGAMFTWLGGIVRTVGDWFTTQLAPALAAAGAGFGEMLGPHIQQIGTILTEDVWPIIQDVGRFIGENLPGAIGVLAPLLTGLVDAGLSAVELALRAIATTWDTYLKPAMEALGGWIEQITGGWENLAEGANQIKDTFGQLAESARALANGDIAGAAGFGQSLNTGQQSFLSGMLGGLLPGAQAALPGFAGGVSNFAGGLAVVGERGPEVVRLPGGSDVIPNGRAFGGGGSTVNVSINVTGSVVAERDLVEQVRTGLLDILRRNGTTGLA